VKPPKFPATWDGCYRTWIRIDDPPVPRALLWTLRWIETEELVEMYPERKRR
jgi:hypothetical protein